MRRRDDSGGRGKALELWQAPDSAGEPLCCVASTFTFHATFFEVECLGRFLQMDTHPQETESASYLIEREEKLAGTRVCVLADRRHATEKESLRWDVLPVVVPRAAQHAKLSLLVWANHVRVIIGSGNLTEDGYRKNLEVFGCLETSREKAGSHAAILESITFLERVADRALGDEAKPGPKQRLADTLARARKRIRDWPHEERGRARVVPVFGGIGPSVPEQLRDCWPPGSPPRYARVLSPFFDATPQSSGIVPALADLLAKRGERVCRFYVAADELPDGRIRLFAPRALIDAVREGAATFVHKLSPKQDEEFRPVHAKMLALQNDEWQALLIGSSNFTRAGFGITARAANLEANLAYLSRADEPESRLLERVWPEVADEEVDLDSQAAVWDPAVDPDADGNGPPPLPAAFREALFDAAATPCQLILSFREGLPQQWTIKSTAGIDILHSGSWKGGPGEVLIPWTDDPPVVLQVRWGDEGYTAAWPVNVVDTRALPAPADLRNKSLEELLAILASTRPLHQAVVEVLRRPGRRKPADVALDPHKRVDTTSFLLQRTKRLALALDRLRERLERPVASIEALDWRLLGPVGPRALAEAIARDARSADEARFFMAELALALKRVRPREAARGGLGARLIGERIAAAVADVADRSSALPGAAGTAMERYVTAAFASVRSR